MKAAFGLSGNIAKSVSGCVLRKQALFAACFVAMCSFLLLTQAFLGRVSWPDLFWAPQDATVFFGGERAKLLGPLTVETDNLNYDRGRRFYVLNARERGTFRIHINSPYLFDELFCRLTFGEQAIKNRIEVKTDSGRTVPILADKMPKMYYVDVSKGFRGRSKGTIELTFTNDTDRPMDVFQRSYRLCGRFYAAHQLIPGLLHILTIPLVIFWLGLHSGTKSAGRRTIAAVVCALIALVAVRFALGLWFGPFLLMAPWIYGLALGCALLVVALWSSVGRDTLVHGAGTFLAASLLYYGLAMRLLWVAQKYFARPGMVGGDTLFWFRRSKDSYLDFFAPAAHEPLHSFLLKAMYGILNFPASEINYTSICTVFLSIAAGLALFVLARKLFGSLPALVALAIYIFDKVEIETMSAVGYREQGMFILIIGYLGLLFAKDRFDNVGRSVLAGILAGLTILCRLGCMYWVLLMGLYLAVFRRKTHPWRQIAIHVAVAFLVAAPLFRGSWYVDRRHHPDATSLGDPVAMYMLDIEFREDYRVPTAAEYAKNHMAGANLSIVSYIFQWHSLREIVVHSVEPFYRSLFLTSGIISRYNHFHSATLAAMLLPFGMAALLAAKRYRWMVVSYITYMAPIVFVMHLQPYTRYLYAMFPILCLGCAFPVFLAGEYLRGGRERLADMLSVREPLTKACLLGGLVFVAVGITQYDNLRTGLDRVFNMRGVSIKHTVAGVAYKHGNLFDIAIPVFPHTRRFEPLLSVAENGKANVAVALQRGKNRIHLIGDFGGSLEMVDLTVSDPRCRIRRPLPGEPNVKAATFIVTTPRLGEYHLIIRNGSGDSVQLHELIVESES